MAHLTTRTLEQPNTFKEQYFYKKYFYYLELTQQGIAHKPALLKAQISVAEYLYFEARLPQAI